MFIDSVRNHLICGWHVPVILAESGELQGYTTSFKTSSVIQ